MTAAILSMNEPLSLADGRPADADSDLVARCREGDAAAYREIYQLHRSRVYRVVSRFVTNEADREEVVQDAFLQVVRSLPGFRGGSKLSTWIHRVAINVTLQYIRRKKSRIRLRLAGEMPDHTLATAEDQPISPEETAMRRERLEAVNRALDSLSAKKRVALVLADFEGLPSREIAAIVEAPVLTVRTRLFYARKEFYALLGEDAAFAEIDLKKGKR